MRGSCSSFIKMEVLLYCVFGLIAFVPATYCLNLGIIPGDLRRITSPLTTPGIIKIPHITSPLLPRRLSAKPCPLKKKIKPLIKRSLLKHKLLKIPRLRKLPIIPKLPLLPILPPIIPKIPLLPLPLLPLPLLPIIAPLPLTPPILPKASKLLKPLQVPILGKGRLQKALGSELIPVLIPAQNIRRTENILQKLLNLKNKGTLTTAQLIRLKKVLL